MSGEDEDFDDFGDEWTDEDGSRVRDRVEGLMRDVLKRALSQGRGARQVTEDRIRNAAKEVPLPREVVSYILSQVDTVKTDITRVVSGEVRDFLESANLAEEIARILTTLSFEIRTEVRFVPNDDRLRPSVKNRVKVKSNRDGDNDAETDEYDEAIRSSVSTLASRVIDRLSGGGDTSSTAAPKSAPKSAQADEADEEAAADGEKAAKPAGKVPASDAKKSPVKRKATRKKSKPAGDEE